ncbi:MAG TPA: hydrogenase maturation nickel metallochaperone HypA, partial [Gammaproteobacteria bacterium]|nr:hydrogenase maturation nickel metallochaperone HypA [Gammaproteobacteria bacterium]
LEIGSLAGVEIEAMRFGFDVVMKGSLADGARLEIIERPGQAWCLPCAKAVAVAQRFDACPECGSHQLQVTGGEEMRIKELEVE